MRYIYTNGCFDGLHAGHIELLRYCKRLAGVDGQVIIGLNSDRWMRVHKREPKFSQEKRREDLFTTGYIKDVYRIDFEDEIKRHLKALRKSIEDGTINEVYLVKGMDYEPENINGANIDGITLVRIPLVSNEKGDKLSSSQGD
jgi:cytidyltransferase-like protein